MKKLIVIFLLIAAGIAALVLFYVEMREERDREAEAEAPTAGPSRIERGADGANVLKLDGETQKRLGLQVAAPGPGSVAVEVSATARVLDGATLAASLNDLRAGQAALEAARADFERKKRLFENGQNAAASSVEQAESLLKQQQLAVETIRDRLVASWGQPIAGREDLGTLSRLLLQREAAVVRVELLATDKAPSAATVRLSRHNGEDIAAARLLGPAASTDSIAAGQSLLALVPTNATSLVPGSLLLAHLDTGVVQRGILIPRSAIVRHAGAGWVYVQSAPETFVRREAPLDRPHPDGWLVTGEWAQPIVVGGAQSLLSEELKGSIQMKD